MKHCSFTIALVICLFCCSRDLHAQSGKTLFYIDSTAIHPEDLDPTETTIQVADMAVFRRITAKDSLQQLGFPDVDTVMFIITKAWLSRPDSLRHIPTLKQLVLKNDHLYLDTLKQPYSGPFIEYYLNGAKKTFGDVVNGQIEGYANVFYPDGSLMESHYYSHNKEDGMREEYFPNGVIKRRGRFKDGEMEEYWQEWYSTGKLKREVYFLHSTPHFPDEENVFYDMLQEATAQIMNGDYRSAMRNLDELRKMNPDYAEVQYNTGDAQAHLKKYDKAIAAFSKALELEPMYKEAYQKRIECNIALLQEAAAKNKSLSDAAEHNKQICGDVQALMNMGDKSRKLNNLRTQYCH
ncbi:tetratricopeptide repeat protein [Deminuibacter soli]|uniref:tetratricopeptide repeat protein n=1 Tax=Deminuibacter soli TaxID=2291815 RepID=UPI0013142974|nr:tetratricopeptide repeat protein [Deminuibacter soli]